MKSSLKRRLKKALRKSILYGAKCSKLSTPILTKRRRIDTPKRKKNYSPLKASRLLTPIKKLKEIPSSMTVDASKKKPLTPRTLIYYSQIQTRDNCTSESSKFNNPSNDYSSSFSSSSSQSLGQSYSFNDSPKVMEFNFSDLGGSSQLYRFNSYKENHFPRMGLRSRSEKTLMDRYSRKRSLSNVIVKDRLEFSGLRPIIIDGSNVAFAHGASKGNGQIFSVQGINICVEYFKLRGHSKIVAFLPQYRLKNGGIFQRELLEKMKNNGNMAFTPSRTLTDGRSISSYDDRYIVQYAALHEGIIVSNDNYRDLSHESLQMKEAIEERLLMYTFVGDTLMFPQDPLGRHGPSLDAFLSYH